MVVVLSHRVLEQFVLKEQITDIHLLKHDWVPTLWYGMGTERWLSYGLCSEE